MQFGILGPLELRAAGVPVRLGDEKPRVVLACLLLQRNRVVPADRLIEWVWGDKPPRTAANVLQAHIGAIRKALATADPRTGSALETRPPGYILHVEPDDLDAAVFDGSCTRMSTIRLTQVRQNCRYSRHSACGGATCSTASICRSSSA